jgi:hypothetical protein
VTHPHNQPESIAIHEAAHAVVFILNGVDIVDVSFTHEGLAGACNLGTPLRWADGMLPGVLAGPVASNFYFYEDYLALDGEYRHEHRACDMTDDPAFKLDLADAILLAKEGLGANADSLAIERLLVESYTETLSRWVAPHWNCIEAVARVLLKKRTLTGAEVRRILSTLPISIYRLPTNMGWRIGQNSLQNFLDID